LEIAQAADAGRHFLILRAVSLESAVGFLEFQHGFLEQAPNIVWRRLCRGHGGTFNQRAMGDFNRLGLCRRRAAAIKWRGKPANFLGAFV
jgi:hypothetical protein